MRTATSGENATVYFCESDLKTIYDQVAGSVGMSWRQFQDMAQAEADKAARESAPAIYVANEALAGLSNDQALLSIRFCIRIGPIRICVEWLL